ncbi:MAG: hypothetical protein IKP07_04150 [Bacilli bacterium]|nr:hypothetical protein [Bacilli bacterium]
MNDDAILQQALDSLSYDPIYSLCYIYYNGQYVKVPKVLTVEPILNPVEGSAERNAEADLTTYEVARVPDLKMTVGNTTFKEAMLILQMVKTKPFKVKWYNLESGQYYINDYYCPGIQYSFKPTKDGCKEASIELIAYRDVERGRYNE